VPLPRVGVGKPQGAARHGFTVAEIESAARAQRGACAVCQRPLPAVPIVDHDHELARLHGHPETRGCRRCVRGLLCEDCNLGLGRFRDDPEALRRAAAYLEAYRARLHRLDTRDVSGVR
jgi:hypothetical protein